MISSVSRDLYLENYIAVHVNSEALLLASVWSTKRGFSQYYLVPMYVDARVLGF